jgi:hypothetical protein
MTHPQNIGPRWRDEDWPAECPACGGKPDHSPATCTTHPSAPTEGKAA